MTHDGSNLDAHLAALHDHGQQVRQEAKDASMAAHTELEAERAAAQPHGEPGGQPAPSNT